MSLSQEARRSLQKTRLEIRIKQLEKAMSGSMSARDMDLSIRESCKCKEELEALKSQMTALGELKPKKKMTKKPSAKKEE